jgi:hypothetical protein
MNQLESINRIVTLLSRFVAEVKGLNAINQYGINYISENVLIPIFKEVFSYHDLENLNNQENNVSGIDIADKTAKVAFQITATADNEKVKHTLRQFLKSEHFKNFQTLFIYIITEKKDFYSDKDYSEILENKISFDKEKHIIDYRDLIRKINGITDLKVIQRVEALLELQFSEKKLEGIKEQFDGSNQEQVVANLLEITFPSVLYVAKMNVDRNAVLKKMHNKKANDREVIFAFKKQNNLRFSADWIDFNKQIFSFHDLRNRQHDLSKIADQGTVDSIEPSDFYLQSSDHLRAFKALLKYCFSKQAYFLGIEFIHDDNVYVFAPENENVITRGEVWNSGKRSASRDVIRVKLHKKDSHPWYYTNLAFSINFRLYDDKWFLELSPEWYITKDGRQKHYYMHESVSSFLKRQERNQHVLNHVKFIGNYLKHGKTQTEIFAEEAQKPTNFLVFSRFFSFKNSIKLSEDLWAGNESDESLKEMKDKDGSLDLDV